MTLLASLISFVLFLIWTDQNLKTKLFKWFTISSVSGKTGSDVARELISSYKLEGVTVGIVKGTLTDNYDPQKRLINLSEEVYYGNTLAATSIAAHEVGHAQCHHERGRLMKARQIILPYMYLIIGCIPLLLILGLFFHRWSLSLLILAVVSVVAFQIITLFVELDASRRAFSMLQLQGLIIKPEYYGVKETLNSAALTYVAAIFRW